MSLIPQLCSIPIDVPQFQCLIASSSSVAILPSLAIFIHFKSWSPPLQHSCCSLDARLKKKKECVTHARRRRTTDPLSIHFKPWSPSCSRPCHCCPRRTADLQPAVHPRLSCCSPYFFACCFNFILLFSLIP